MVEVKEENGLAIERNKEEKDWKKNYQWDNKTKGIIIELKTMIKNSTKEQNKQRIKLFGEIMKKAIEIKLHISETSLRSYTNFQERKIVIYEKGGEMGNVEQIFRKMNKVLEGMRELIGGEEEDEKRWTEQVIEGIRKETREEIMKIIEEDR